MLESDRHTSIENYLKNFQAQKETSDSTENNSGVVTKTIQEVELTFQDKVRQILERQHRIKIFSGNESARFTFTAVKYLGRSHHC